MNCWYYSVCMGTVKRPYRSQVRTEQAEATRRRIVDAARRLFARQGYQGATMQQLAEEAGVATQTLYVAFGSKLNLAAAVIGDALSAAGIPELVRQSARIGDPEEALRYVAHVNRLVDERLVDLQDLLNVASLRETAQLSDQLRERDLAGVLAIVSNSPRRREVSEEDLRDTLLALTSPSLYQMLVKERGWSADRYERWLGDLLVKALLE